MSSHLISIDPIKRLYQCNACNKPEVEENKSGMPEGFHVSITKVDNKGKWTENNKDIWYCSKNCFMDGIRFHNY